MRVTRRSHSHRTRAATAQWTSNCSPLVPWTLDGGDRCLVQRCLSVREFIRHLCPSIDARRAVQLAAPRLITVSGYLKEVRFALSADSSLVRLMTDALCKNATDDLMQGGCADFTLGPSIDFRTARPLTRPTRRPSAKAPTTAGSRARP